MSDELREALAKARRAWAENTLRYYCNGKLRYASPRSRCDGCGKIAAEHDAQHDQQMSLEIDT